MATRNNPILGQDLVRIGWKALGLMATGSLNDKILYPLVKRFAPGQGAASQMVHGVSAIGTAAGLGFAAKSLGQRAIGSDLAEGGTILGVGEIFMAVVPGATLTGTFPTSLPARAVPVALPSGGSAPAIALVPASLPARSYSGA